MINKDTSKYLDYRAYVRCKNLNIKLNEYFQNENVIIYGFDVIGRAIFNELNDVNVLCFLDQKPEMSEYKGCPVYELTEDNINKVKNTNAIIIISYTYYWKEICSTLNKLLGKTTKIKYKLFIEIAAQLCMCKLQSQIQDENLNLNNLFPLEAHKVSNVCIAGTPYGLLLYLLFNGQIDKTLFIFDGFYPLEQPAKILRTFGAVCALTSYNEHVLEERDSIHDLVRAIALNNSYGMPVYGQDTVPLIKEFLESDFVLFEDGAASYVNEDKVINPVGYEVYTYNEKIRQIIFTGAKEINKKLLEKSNIIDIKYLWKEKSDCEKIKIMKVFGFDYHKMKEIINEGRDILLITQGYSQMGLCSKDDQIQLYKEILNEFDSKRIIIKPHPIDDICYEKYFKDCAVLPNKFPSEFIFLCGLKINTILATHEACNSLVFVDAECEVRIFRQLLDKYKIETTMYPQ